MPNTAVLISHLLSIIVFLAFAVGFFVSNNALRKERQKVVRLEEELAELKKASQKN